MCLFLLAVGVDLCFGTQLSHYLQLGNYSWKLCFVLDKLHFIITDKLELDAICFPFNSQTLD